MNLRSENIFLRALEPGDINTVYTWENNPAIWRVSNTVTPYSKFVLEQYLVNAHEDIFSSKQVRLMICLQDQTPIGTIELFDFDPHNSRTGIGILVDETQQKKGYATEALQLLLDYCFRILMVKQVYCNISISNEKSLYLFKKLGFTEAGLKKNWNKINHHVFEDEWMLQLMNE